MTAINPDVILVRKMEKLSKRELEEIIKESNKIIKQAQCNYKIKKTKEKTILSELYLSVMSFT